jgi:alpha-L-rhamnosidase
MDHEPTWSRVVAAAIEAGVAADEVTLAGRLERFLDFPTSELVEAVTARGFVPGAEAFRAGLSFLSDDRS